MGWKIEVKDKPGIFDAIGEGIRKGIGDLNISGVTGVRYIQVYVLEGEVSRRQVDRIAEELLCDPITQEYRAFSEGKSGETPCPGSFMVEVAYNPGVMDPVEESALKGIRDMGAAGVSAVSTAQKYLITGAITPRQLETISEKLLYNRIIQHIVRPSAARRQPSAYAFTPVTVPLSAASEQKLRQISRKGQLFLNAAEMRQIQKYFRSLKREPTDCELETIAQTWSEHCSHKTFRGNIDYRETGKKKTRKLKIKNLLKSTIMKVTRELDKPWCVSVFNDNAGVIRFDGQNNVCFKVETHNHPSALEPYGGANTGIGGVIRDPMGTGLGAQPVFNTDVFCFGPPDHAFDRLPSGTLHPKRVMKGVVAGVRDYGNKMGIPTVNGAVLFHEGFVGNPLVYCGTAGIMPRNKSFKKVCRGDRIVVVGGRTGRDGIHGATFSSGELTHESESVSGGAVQIGNPIQEKKMLDAIIKARDLGLYRAITDCGAGGLSSAVGEMGAELGASVNLEKVPLKYRGLSYTEIWISESQERMVLAVPPKLFLRLSEVFAGENVEAVAIGEFTGTGRLELLFEGNKVCDLDMEFLHEGLPKIEKKAVFHAVVHREPSLPDMPACGESLRRLLGHYDICSKEWVVRQYDHEVQGGSVLKPLVGAQNDGPSDAAIVRPILSSSKGLAVGCGINFRFGMIDPYWMAASCIDEALRQIVACGASLEKTALLDNFCWGNPDKPDRLGGLVRSALACYDVAKGFGVPFISGKDSLYNEYTVNGKSLAIPGTLLISALSVMEDVTSAVSMYAKKPGDYIYAVGVTRDELGGSHYFDLFDSIGNGVPRVDVKKASAVFRAVHEAASRKLIRACHDCSDGGIGVAAAEMAFAGGLGMELFLKEVPYETGDGNGKTGLRDDFILFSESNSRFLIEVDPADRGKFERLMRRMGAACGCIGCVEASEDFVVYGLDSAECVRERVYSLKDAWQKTLRW